MSASDNGSNPNPAFSSGAPLLGARQRAAAAAAAAAMDRATLVTFVIGDAMLAAPVESVERILRCTELHRSTEGVFGAAGIVDFRGGVVPVIDLRQKSGRSDVIIGSATRVILFNAASGLRGGIVDSVSEVVTVDAATIVSPEGSVRGIQLGSIRLRDRNVTVLDVSKLFQSDEPLRLIYDAAESAVPVTRGA
ncbi:MAG: chemotaxis protein CheW [Gemmatimonas sp.]